MKVVIDDKSGFCFGVVRAISAAENALSGTDVVYSLGDIVHNRMEVARLESLGLQTVKSNNQFESMPDSTVLIRAHGEPPETYLQAERNGIKIVDATCPVVAHLQRTVKKVYKQMQDVNGQVVILGKRGHAEVVGLTGQIDQQATVIEGLSDLELIDFSRPIYLLSQTTQSPELFDQVKVEIEKRATGEVTIHDTICRQVSNRNNHLRQFARHYDVIIFVSGSKSSNGKALCEICRASNPKTYNIEDETELQSEWFDGASSVGVCGATSTPKWLMEQVATAIQSRF